MSDAIEIRGLSELQKALRETPDELFEQTKEVFVDVVLRAQKEVSGNLTGSPMKSRTGLLRKSIKTSVSGDDVDTLRVSLFAANRVGSTQISYAPIHEFGGTIKAKKAYRGVAGAPYLNIPTEANKTAAGVMRYTPKYVFQQMGGYIVGKGVYVPVTVGGGSDDSGDTAGVKMFHLVKSVKIKARLGMHDAVEGQIPTLLSQLNNMRIMPT